MQLPLADAYDKLSILYIYQLIGKRDVQAEIDALRRHIDTESGYLFDHVSRLLIVNSMIWGLESDIRLGREGILGLEEVGRRALKIRELNSIRTGIKAEIAKSAGEFEPQKVDHASAPTQTKQEPVAHTDDLTGHTD